MKTDKDFLLNHEFVTWRLLHTEEQDQYWARYREEHPECREALDSAIQKFNSVENFQLAEPEQEKFLQRIFAKRSQVRRKRIMHRSAAVVAAVLVVSSLFVGLQPFAERQGISNMEDIIGQATPSNDIQLISGEKVISLKQDVQIALKDGRFSMVEETEVSEMSLSENAMNKLIVPAGKRSTLHLDDGTKIWLNSGTELDFPSKFGGDKREIAMKGEIYIEVAKGQQPFYVSTPQFRVQVHGTKFNISAYGGNEENNVVLVEGSVEVITAGEKSTWLTPSEKAVVSAERVSKKTVDVEEYICWKDDVLIFNQTPIAEALRKIGRYYNVHFEDITDDELSAETCVGKLFLSDDLDETLITLTTIFSAQFHKDGDMIYVKRMAE